MPRFNPYTNQKNPDGKTGKIWLQGVGFHRAVIASELQIGDTLVWNTGATSDVAEIVSVTKAFVTIKEKYLVRQDVKFYDRRLKKDRLVAVGKAAYERVAKKNSPLTL